MKIIEIKKDRWSYKYIVEFENNETYKLSLNQIIKYNLKEDEEVNYLDLIEKINFDNTQKAFNKALDLLSFKDYTSFEIKNKLLKIGYSEDVLINVFEKLKEYNFINDEKYAINYVEYAKKYKKHGKTKILYSLKQKGISSSILNNLDFNDDVELEYAIKLGEKKLSTLQNIDRKKDKIYRYLLSKGYKSDICLKVINILNIQS